jgi:hypothetical protein
VRTLPRTAAALFLFLLAAAPARADWIDVKGEGAMNGDIVEETADTVKFKDGEGRVHEYRRDQINFMEKEKKKPKASASPMSLFSGKKETAGAAPAAGAAADKFAIRSFLPEDSPLKPAEEALAAGGKTFRDYLYYDADFVEYLQRSARSLEKISKDKTFKPSNLGLALAGLVLLLAGMVFLVIYGFKLMMSMFEAGFLWGVVFLCNAGSAYLSRMLGGPFGLFFSVVPQALSFAFVILHWPVARRAVTMQLYSLAVFFAGWNLLAMSM